MPITLHNVHEVKNVAGAEVAHSVVPRLGRQDWIAASLIAVLGNLLRIGVLAIFAQANEDNLGGLLTKWDAKYYTEIARAGYFGADVAADGNVNEVTMAFFPGFPLVIKAGSFFVANEAAVAIVFNFFFTFLMAAGVMAIAQRIGAGFKARLVAAIAVSSAPMSIVFVMPYTEALFGALVMWMLVALLDEKWWLAGLFGFALSAVRLTSIDVLVVFALIVLFKAVREWKAWLSLIFAAIPLGAYLTWANSYLGQAGGYFGIQEKHWNSHFDFGAATLKWIWSTLLTSDNVGYLLSTLVIVGAPILLLLGWRRLPAPVWLFAAALIANVLFSDGIMHSRPRLLLPAAVLFIPWAIKLANSASTRSTVALCGAYVLFGAWFSAHMLAVFEWAI